MHLITRVYGVLLAFYPSVFRAEFGEEMQDVFAAALTEVQHTGGDQLWRLIWRELRGWPGSVWREHLRERSNKMTIQDPNRPLRPGELLVALTIFLIPQLVILLTVIVDNAPGWLGYIFLGSAIGPLVLALVRGFPRWSPPYLGVLLVGFVFFGPFWVVWGLVYPFVTRWFGGMYTWSILIRIFVQGMQAALMWLLVLLTALILVSLLRLLPHTRTLWQRIRQDWTQLSFLIYGGLVFNTLLIFEEYQQVEPWQIAAWISLSIGCWLYLHAGEQYQRILILLCSATLAMWIVAAGKWFLVPHQNWPVNLEAERPFEALRTLASWICILAALMAPALLNLLPRIQKPTLQEDSKPA